MKTEQTVGKWLKIHFNEICPKNALNIMNWYIKVKAPTSILSI